jgi:hypothetical protein
MKAAIETAIKVVHFVIRAPPSSPQNRQPDKSSLSLTISFIA